MKKLIAAIILASALVTLFAGCTPKDKIYVDFIDVGKGDCILIRTGEENILVDAGYSGTAGKVTDYLSALGVDKVDRMIITHYDKDHVGGAVKLASAFNVGKLYLPGYEPDNNRFTDLVNWAGSNGVEKIKVDGNIAFESGSAEFVIYSSDVVYNPESSDEGNDNDVSLVIGLTYSTRKILLAGDIEKEGIKSFLSKGIGEFDIIKMPHHGKKEGNTSDLLDSVNPKYAVITDETGDEADDKVLTLLENRGIRIYRSSQSGNIRFVLYSDGGVDVKENITSAS